MSFDFEFMFADFDNDILQIEMPNGAVHEYSLSTEKKLWDGGIANGVEHKSVGHSDEMDEDRYTDEYEDTHYWSIGGDKHGFSPKYDDFWD